VERPPPGGQPVVVALVPADAGGSAQLVGLQQLGGHDAGGASQDSKRKLFSNVSECSETQKK
jgi:hypothetical protein